MGVKPKYFSSLDDTIDVKILVDTSGIYPRVLPEDEENELRKKSEALPDNIIEETSTWCRPNWGVHQWIEDKSFVRRSPDPKVNPEFSIANYTLARIQTLLLDWTLEELPKGKKALTRVPAPDSKTTKILILNPESMMKVINCDPVVVNAFYIKAMKLLYPTEEERKNSQ